jgi:hypothetical protein
MYCSQCGVQNADGNVRCMNCGSDFQATAARAPSLVPSEPGSGVEMIIPYRNVAGLIAYYLGIFSILGGFVLGVPAVILGIIGVKNANLHPEVRGKIHAWVGIILGSFMTVVSLAVIALLIVGVTHR